jgi:hypothetical protein
MLSNSQLDQLQPLVCVATLPSGTSRPRPRPLAVLAGAAGVWVRGYLDTAHGAEAHKHLADPEPDRGSRRNPALVLLGDSRIGFAPSANALGTCPHARVPVRAQPGELTHGPPFRIGNNGATEATLSVDPQADSGRCQI